MSTGGKWVPHLCATCPAIPRGPGPRAVLPSYLPVLWIHDRNEKDIDSVPLVENDLVCCRASQDLISSFWPFQGSVAVGVVAAHVVLGRRTGVCPLTLGTGEAVPVPQTPSHVSTAPCPPAPTVRVRAWRSSGRPVPDPVEDVVAAA